MMHTLSTSGINDTRQGLAILKSKAEQKTFKLVAVPGGESGVKL